MHINRIMFLLSFIIYYFIIDYDNKSSPNRRLGLLGPIGAQPYIIYDFVSLKSSREGNPPRTHPSLAQLSTEY